MSILPPFPEAQLAPALPFPAPCLYAVRVAWVIIAFIAWGAYGNIDSAVGTGFRVAFYSLDAILAATAFTLYAVVARFWADLAYAARQGTGTPRPIGGGDEYRYRIYRMWYGTIQNCARWYAIVWFDITMVFFPIIFTFQLNS